MGRVEVELYNEDSDDCDETVELATLGREDRAATGTSGGGLTVIESSESLSSSSATLVPGNKNRWWLQHNVLAV